MRKKTLSFKNVAVKNIKTTYYKIGITPQITKELSQFTKAIFPLEEPVIHAGTNELIANGHYLEAYKKAGVKIIRVAVADFPEEELIHAVFLHWKPVQSYVKLLPIMHQLLKYYSKKSKGAGSKYRTTKDGETLRAYIAELCGINRTYFDYIIKVGNYDRKLLASVDEGKISLLDAVNMVPKRASKTGAKKLGGGRVIPMNQQIHITSSGNLSQAERNLICNALPKVLSDKLISGRIPSCLQVDKHLNHKKELLNFHLHYELNNTLVTSEVIPITAVAQTAKAA